MPDWPPSSGSLCSPSSTSRRRVTSGGLREWAGRAPERSTDLGVPAQPVPGRVVAQPNLARRAEPASGSRCRPARPGGSARGCAHARSRRHGRGGAGRRRSSFGQDARTSRGHRLCGRRRRGGQVPRAGRRNRSGRGRDEYFQRHGRGWVRHPRGDRSSRVRHPRGDSSRVRHPRGDRSSRVRHAHGGERRSPGRSAAGEAGRARSEAECSRGEARRFRGDTAAGCAGPGRHSQRGLLAHSAVPKPGGPATPAGGRPSGRAAGPAPRSRCGQSRRARRGHAGHRRTRRSSRPPANRAPAAVRQHAQPAPRDRRSARAGIGVAAFADPAVGRRRPVLAVRAAVAGGRQCGGAQRGRGHGNGSTATSAARSTPRRSRWPF